MNIKVVNISLDTTDAEIRKLFSSYGRVEFAVVNRSALNGRSLKSGQVNMPVVEQARQAIVSLDKTLFGGKIISVSEMPADLY